MNEREQRGLLIAATSRITRKGNAWYVPSQANTGQRYVVVPHPEQPTCSCPDHETRGCKCKHIFAVEFVMKREENPDGSTTTTQAVVVTEKKQRPTYSQDWKNYNAAQVNEKDKFLQLLHDLTRQIPDRRQFHRGRKPIPLGSALFSAAYKVYSTFSGRRFMSDLRDAQARGFVEACPCYNSIFNVFGDESVTPILTELIEQTSLPLKSVESDFAVDSSGFTTTRFVRWYDQKWGKVREWHHWIKVQLICGTKTNVVTGVELPESDGPDTPWLPPLVRTTAKNFKIASVVADKGYSSVLCHETIDDVGAVPFIPFKSNATGWSGGLWAKCFHYFQFRRDDFLKFYHKRSNVESTFSMVKRKFGDSLRSKTDVALRNELLCKILCHNICCLIHAMFELGIEPSFWADGSQEELKAV